MPEWILRITSFPKCTQCFRGQGDWSKGGLKWITQSFRLSTPIIVTLHVYIYIFRTHSFWKPNLASLHVFNIPVLTIPHIYYNDLDYVYSSIQLQTRLSTAFKKKKMFLI